MSWEWDWLAIAVVLALGAAGFSWEWNFRRLVTPLQSIQDVDRAIDEHGFVWLRQGLLIVEYAMLVSESTNELRERPAVEFLNDANRMSLRLLLDGTWLGYFTIALYAACVLGMLGVALLVHDALSIVAVVAALFPFGFAVLEYRRIRGRCGRHGRAVLDTLRLPSPRRLDVLRQLVSEAESDARTA